MILKAEHINRFINNRLKILTKSDLGVGAGNQTHIGLVEDCFEDWKDTRKINSYVICDEKIYYTCSLIDPIKSHDGSLRSPKLRQGSFEELKGATSSLLLIRDVARPGDGLSLVKIDGILLILIIPSEKLDSKETVVTVKHFGVYKNKKDFDKLNLNLINEQILKKLESIQVQELILKTELTDIIEDVRILNNYKNWAHNNLLKFILNTDRFRLRNWGLKCEYQFLMSILDFIEKNSIIDTNLSSVDENGIKKNILKVNTPKELTPDIEELKKFDVDKLCRFYDRNYNSIWRKINILNRSNLSILKITAELGLEWPSNTHLPKNISDYYYDRTSNLFGQPGLGNKKLKSLIISIYWASLGQDFTNYSSHDIEVFKKLNLDDLYKFYVSRSEEMWASIIKLKRENLLIQKIANEINITWPSSSGYQHKLISDYNKNTTEELFRTKGLGKKKIRTIILSFYWASLGRDFEKQVVNLSSPKDLFVLSGLSEIQINILHLRYLDTDTRTLEETGKIIKVTRERIRQIEASAIKKIKLLGQKEVCRKWIRSNSDKIWKLLSKDGGLTVKGNSAESYLNNRLPGEYQLGLLIADLNASEILDEVGDRIDDWWLRRDE